MREGVRLIYLAMPPVNGSLVWFLNYFYDTWFAGPLGNFFTIYGLILSLKDLETEAIYKSISAEIGLREPYRKPIDIMRDIQLSLSRPSFDTM